MNGARGFLVPANSGRPTRVRVPNRHVKASDADTDGAFMVVEYVLSRDVPPHVHLGQHESFYVLGGSLVVQVGGDEFLAEYGDFVFLPADVPHAITPNLGTSPRLLVVATPNALSGGVYPVVAGTTPEASPGGWAEWRSLHGWDRWG